METLVGEFTLAQQLREEFANEVVTELRSEGQVEGKRW